MKTYTVASTFLYDHINRDLLNIENVQGSKGRSCLVNLNEDEYDGLLSDAEFYAEGGGGFGSEYNYLMRSAAATVRALIKQGPPMAKPKEIAWSLLNHHQVRKTH